MSSLFYYINQLASGNMTYSSQATNFPANNARTRIPSEAWRSGSGVGSNWGYFTITANLNNKLNFNEGGANLTANLTAGNYSANTLCAHLKAQMEAVGTANAYTWDYIETGNNAYHFRVTKASGTLNLLWANGANNATSVANTIGYNNAADDTGALTYTADSVRIHTEEWLKNDMGSNKSIYGVFIKNHNFGNNATVLFQLNASDSWSAPSVNQAVTVQSDIMGYVWTSAQNYQWARLLIQDVDNSDGYVKVGVLWFGSRFAPTRDYEEKYSRGLSDPSILKYSSGGQLSTIVKDIYRIGDFFYPNSNDHANFETMVQTVGLSRSLFFVEDSENLLTTMRYGRLTKYEPTHAYGTRWNIGIGFEDAR